MSDTCIEMDRIGSFVNSFPKYQFIGVSIVMPVTCVAMVLGMGRTIMENTARSRTVYMFYMGIIARLLCLLIIALFGK